MLLKQFRYSKVLAPILATLVWHYTIGGKLAWVGLIVLLHAKWLAHQLVWLCELIARVGYNLYC